MVAKGCIELVWRAIAMNPRLNVFLECASLKAVRVYIKDKNVLCEDSTCDRFIERLMTTLPYFLLPQVDDIREYSLSLSFFKPANSSLMMP